VICGNAIVTYEHMEPRFADAREHSPEDITLLCAGHQLESTKRLLSLATVREHDKDPAAKRQGFSNYVFDLGGNYPKVVLGSVVLTGGRRRGVVVSDEWRLLVEPPEKHSRMWQLSATFQDEQGRIVCKIDRNELMILPDNYDVVQEGREFRIKGLGGETDAIMVIEPPNRLHITWMNIIDGGKFVRVRGDLIRLHENRTIWNIDLNGPSLLINKQGEVSFGLLLGLS
jgi:hypothetical protein